MAEDNSLNDFAAKKRYGEHDVILWRDNGGLLNGTRFLNFPVDAPWIIRVQEVDRVWEQQVWLDKGWTIEERFGFQ